MNNQQMQQSGILETQIPKKMREFLEKTEKED
jgi:hypothetical protein